MKPLLDIIGIRVTIDRISAAYDFYIDQLASIFTIIERQYFLH